MVQHALTHDSPLVVSRLGFMLSCTRGQDLPTAARTKLEAHMLQRPDYFRRSRRTKQDSLLPRWNLILSPALWRYWRR